MRIKKKKMIQYKGKVNDLSVENTSSYNVESFGVHNSSAGSLVCYLLGITEVDPIKHDLIFERFMNPARSYSKHVSFEEYKYLEDFINEK